MPSRNVVRDFQAQQFYHVYNRTERSSSLFFDEQDFNIFLYYLHVYLLPLEDVLQKYKDLPLRLYPKNLNEEIELLAYCLMPNHFHMLLFQRNKDSIPKLLRQLGNAYTKYFNNKYQTVGRLFQGRYRSVSINSFDQLIHVSRYIHLNPTVSKIASDPRFYPWSSLRDYHNNNDVCFVNKRRILEAFPNLNKYEQFVMDQINYGKDLEQIKHLLLD